MSLLRDLHTHFYTHLIIINNRHFHKVYFRPQIAGARRAEIRGAGLHSWEKKAVLNLEPLNQSGTKNYLAKKYLADYRRINFVSFSILET